MNGETKLKYQLSLFGDFSHISPSEETLKKCIESFFVLGLLPNTIQEMDPKTNRMEPRLALQSMRNGLVINFLSNRMDFMLSPLPGTSGAGVTLDKFIEDVSKAYNALVSLFDPVIRRAGFVTETFLKPLDPQQLQRAKNSFITPAFNVFPDSEVVEWSLRNVIPGEVIGVDQPINVIYNLAKVDVQMGDQSGHKQFTTVHLLVDVNMPQEKASFKMDFGLVMSFLESAKKYDRDIYKGIAAVVYE